MEIAKIIEKVVADMTKILVEINQIEKDEDKLVASFTLIELCRRISEKKDIK